MDDGSGTVVILNPSIEKSPSTRLIVNDSLAAKVFPEVKV